MTSKSISFNCEMMQALLDGRKTQTRRPHTGAKYQVGDIILVKESYGFHIWKSGTGTVGEYFCYKADNPLRTEVSGEGLEKEYPKIVDWQPADTLSEQRVRVKIKITSIKKEKLQDITEQDAIAEGFPVGEFIVFTNFKSIFTVNICIDISYNTICRCFNLENAIKIAKLLNEDLKRGEHAN